MLERAEGWPLANHAKARFEQRLIVSPAIVGDQHFELFEILVQRAQLAGFFAEIAHEKLADAKSMRRYAAHSDQERIGSRASRQSGGLGIEEAPFRGRNPSDLAIRDGIQQIGRQILQICDADAAVAAVTFVKLFGFAMTAVCGFHLVEREVSGRRWVVSSRWTLRRLRVLLVDLCNAAS